MDMDLSDESDNMQSDVSDEILDEMIDTSDDENFSEIPQDQRLPMASTFATLGSHNSSSNYPAPYPNPPIHLTIRPPKNGLNTSPVFYTSSPPSYVADDRNVANYEEVSTDSSPSHPTPPITISVYSEILRAAAQNSRDPEYPLPSIPLAAYPDNEYQPPPYRPPVRPIQPSNASNIPSSPINSPYEPVNNPSGPINDPSEPINNPYSPINNPSSPINNPSEPINDPSGPINNPSESIMPSQQTTTVMQTVSQDEPAQKAKKRGRKCTGEDAADAKDAKNFDNSIPKKRGRKSKASSDGADGNTNNASLGVSHQPTDDAKLENNEVNVDKARKKEEVKNVDEKKEEKTKKKRSRKKAETKFDETINDTTENKKGRNSARGKSSSAAKKQCVEELLNNQKNRMAFPKGTFLIRYCDLETLECDQIWCVDNHHMLLKYRLTSHIEGKRRLYLKSQPERYVGWKCEEPWHFHELTVLERDRDGSRVLILYPDAKELAECREKAKRQKHLAEEMKHGLGTSRNSGDINQNFDEMRSNTSGMLMDTEEQRLHEQQNMEIQMVDEAAKAIERFILVADSHSAEMDDEQMAEVVDDENSTEEQMIIEEDDN